jgi:hypothetical protein
MDANAEPANEVDRAGITAFRDNVIAAGPATYLGRSAASDYGPYSGVIARPRD